MRVLFTSNIPTPYRTDFFCELSKYCDLTVLYERKTAKDRNKEWLKYDSQSYKVQYLKGIKIGKDIAFCPSILRYLKKGRFDIIVIGGYSSPTGMLAIEWLKLKKIKFILNCDGGFIKHDKKIKFFIKSHFIKSAFVWLSTGKKTNEYLKYYGARGDRIYNYSFTSINNNSLKRKISKEGKNFLKEQLNIKEKKIVISVGQFIYRKGFDVLIRASQFLSKEEGIYIIGGKPTKEYIELKKELNADNVHFIDFMQKKDIEKYYMCADLFVLPTREDIWGLVINEAMAYGLPIITTENCIAGLELIENEKNGYIVPVDDYIGLGNTMKDILENQKLQADMHKNNTEKIKKYTIENMAKEHAIIFRKVLENE